MKTYKLLFCLKALCFSLLLGALFLSCRSNDPVSPLEEMHQKMLGQWETEHGLEAWKRWTITEDSIINTAYYDVDTLHAAPMMYQLLNDSTIYLVRCWVNKDEPHYAMKTKINFDDENTLTINDFSPTIAEVYPPRFVPITLKRK